MSGPAIIEADAASVSLARDGGYLLLLHTSVGCVRFHLPLAVGSHVFRITNPAAPEHGAKADGVRPVARADSSVSGRLTEAAADWMNDPALSLTDACKRHGLRYASALRERLVKTLGLAKYQELSAARGNKRLGPWRKSS